MKLTKKQVDKCFASAKHQEDYVIALYKLVIPDFEQQERITPPRVGQDLHIYIFEKAMEFDRQHHPGVMAGGLWFNKGFSCDSDDKEIGGWEVKL